MEGGEREREREREREGERESVCTFCMCERVPSKREG